MIKKDTKYPRVFISKHYYYFGGNAISVPDKFIELVPKRHGVKCNHNPDAASALVGCIKSNHKQGVHGEPMDNIERKKGNKKSSKNGISRCAPSAACQHKC